MIKTYCDICGKEITDKDAIARPTSQFLSKRVGEFKMIFTVREFFQDLKDIGEPNKPIDDIHLSCWEKVAKDFGLER